MNIKRKTQEFRDKIAALPRKDILEIIRAQDPDLIKQINRIEWVFRNKLAHINDKDGEPITERPMTNEELALLVDEPFQFSEELAELGLTMNHQQQLHISKDPVTFARHFLGVKPRVYQILILRHPNRFKVLRAGRRLGKTYSMAILLLWYSYTTENGRAIVLAPMLAQAKVIYDEIQNLVNEAPVVKDCIVRSVASPPAEIDFSNGSTIRFFTSGMKSNGRSDATRGQEAHLLVLDELDYMGDDDLEAVLAMMQKTDDNQPDKMLIGASTPTGKRGKFYEWCVDPEGKGRFKEFWFPSYCHPNFDKDMEEFLHDEHRTEMGFRHEVEADWGELAEGVYPRSLVERAFFTMPAWEYIPFPTADESTYVMGVDWDKYGAGVSLVVLEICGKAHPQKAMRGLIRCAYREETLREHYTLLKAVDRIVQLNDEFNFAWIYIDRGYGDTQLELLHKHGSDYPHTGLHRKVKGIQFGQSIEVRDPYTMQMQRKEVKPFMVNTLKELLEENKIFFNKTDTALYDQLSHYIVTRTSVTGRPVYEMASEQVPDHAHDALILACLAIAENYNALFKTNYASAARVISNQSFIGTMALPKNEKAAEAEKEAAVKEYGSINAAPLQIKKSMTSTSGGRRSIRRKMF